MSVHSTQYLAENVLQGYTEKIGHAWWYRASEDNPLESNHYDGPVPVEAVRRRLFNWKAESLPVQVPYLTADGVTIITDPDRQAIVRPDTQTILGIFKKGYKIHDYDEWLINNVETILDTDLLGIAAATLLKWGAVASVTIEVPDTIGTPEGVDFRPRLVAVTSLDGSLATTYKRTVGLPICDNTLSLALAEKGQQVKIKHSSNSLGRLQEVRDALEVVHTISDEFAAQVKRLCEVEVTDKQWAEFLKAHVPLEEDATKRATTLVDNKRAALYTLWNSDNRVSPWRNTAFGVLQATNTWNQHLSGVRGETTRQERNALQAIDGTVDRQDREALDTLRKVLVSA